MRVIQSFALTTILGVAALLASACGSDPAGTTTTSTTTGSGGSGTGGSVTGTGGSEAGVCLLHNCNSDLECATCDSMRNTCLIAEHRCVACGAKGCPEGLECSSFGQCVPKGATCPTNNGTPTITCNSSADCVACDPAHQVCDTATKACVACTQNDTSECQSTDLCLAGKCSPKCPKVCDTDNDCGQCGTAQNPAHACNAHACAQCSATYACPAGQICTAHGTCEQRCGLEGPVEGTCEVDADCAKCGGGATHCYTPINGGHGTRGPQAAGCSDLGNGSIVLPDPWNKVTNTCSNDGDCAGVGIQYNVGKLLRELTGFDEINDANVDYGMNTCASVSISDSIACGICVPCEVDADCKALDIDAVAGEAFGPLGAVGSAILLDKIFGPNDHKIHMYCQGVAAGYGVCSPCPGILNDCTVGGGGMGSGMCDHDVCSMGGALKTSCGACEEAVCGVDSYCCDTAWDGQCISEADQYCNNVCAMPGNVCPHDLCTTGDPLAESCSACAADVCAEDPVCCQTTWDSICVDEVTSICGMSCN